MITLEAFVRSFRVSWSKAAEPDVIGYKVHAVKSGELVNGNFTPAANNLIYEGPDTTCIHILADADYGGIYYVKLGAIDTFGTDEINYSDLQSVFVPDLQIMPDELFTTLRTDFFLRDSTFLFGDIDAAGVKTNETTLKWDSGWIDRGDKVYNLAAGTLASADDSYIIATLTEGSPGTAVISKVAFSAGLPALAANQIIVATTTGTPNSVGNYMAYVRQGNSTMMEGAYIRDATITDAKITGTLSANRITTLNGGVVIADSGITITSINNTANTASSTASSAVSAANSAASTISNWTRAGTTKINGGQIYTDDAFVGTLMIQNNAVTIPLSARAGATFMLCAADGWFNVMSLTIDTTLVPKVIISASYIIQTPPSGVTAPLGFTHAYFQARIRRSDGTYLFPRVPSIYEGEFIVPDYFSSHYARTIAATDTAPLRTGADTYYLDISTGLVPTSLDTVERIGVTNVSMTLIGAKK